MKDLLRATKNKKKKFFVSLDLLGQISKIVCRIHPTLPENSGSTTDVYIVLFREAEEDRGVGVGGGPAPDAAHLQPDDSVV